MSDDGAEISLETRLLLEAIYVRFQYDFREYATSSLKRRLTAAVDHFECRSMSGLQERVLHDPLVFPELLKFLTVQVSDMFRDPTFFMSLRTRVVPVLKTYPSIKIWVAGCANGEEVWSLAILLKEEGLLDRSLIYATDINPEALRLAEQAIYPLDRVAAFTRNHQAAGGKGSLSAWYDTAYGSAAIDKSLKKSVVFSDHSLATDSVFAEVQLVLCRNVLIYFKPMLQERAIGLFADALCDRGFLGLGAKESLRFTPSGGRFDELIREDRIYQKRSGR